MESTLSHMTVSPGTRVTMSVNVVPRRAMHVYVTGKHDYQVVGLSITPEPWLRAEPTEVPAVQSRDHFEPTNETIPVYRSRSA